MEIDFPNRLGNNFQTFNQYQWRSITLWCCKNHPRMNIQRWENTQVHFTKYASTTHATYSAHIYWRNDKVLRKKVWPPVTEWFSEGLENISSCSETLITSSFQVSWQCKQNERNCSVISCSLFLSFHTRSAVWKFHKAAMNWSPSLPSNAAICSSHDGVDELKDQEWQSCCSVAAPSAMFPNAALCRVCIPGISVTLNN